MRPNSIRRHLLASTMVAGFAISAPAFAQDAASAPQSANPTKVAAADEPNTIVVTGSITRNPAAATASPVVSVTAADMQNRGISSVADQLQLLSANMPAPRRQAGRPSVSRPAPARHRCAV